MDTYIVVEESDSDVFIKEVQAKMAQGYVLQGGVAFRNDGLYIRYCQAMVHLSAVKVPK